MSRPGLRLRVGTLAIGLVGGGHGWNSGAFSLLGLAFLPSFGAALALPRGIRRNVMAMIAVLMILVDVFVVCGTLDEGVKYLHRA